MKEGEEALDSTAETLDLPTPSADPVLPAIGADVEEVEGLTKVMQPIMQSCRQLDTKAKGSCNSLMTEARKNFDRNVMWIETAKKEQEKENDWLLNGPPKPAYTSGYSSGYASGYSSGYSSGDSSGDSSGPTDPAASEDEAYSSTSFAQEREY